jgi:ABC-type Mn2+/Zn2+ transport system permease subunit
MGALIIIPAATAKRVARNLNGMLYVAVLVAVVATVVGTWMAEWLHRETGPLIVTVAASAFVVKPGASPTVKRQWTLTACRPPKSHPL